MHVVAPSVRTPPRPMVGPGLIAACPHARYSAAHIPHSLPQFPTTENVEPLSITLQARFRMASYRLITRLFSASRSSHFGQKWHPASRGGLYRRTSYHCLWSATAFCPKYSSRSCVRIQEDSCISRSLETIIRQSTSTGEVVVETARQYSPKLYARFLCQISDSVVLGPC